ncbi:hypothetical protein [Salmonella phage PHA46]
MVTQCLLFCLWISDKLSITFYNPNEEYTYEQRSTKPNSIPKEN